MPFSAMLDGVRVDLLGDDADDVWARARAARPEGTLRCKGCDGRLSTRDPVNRSRHFFHPKSSDDCPLAGRTSEAHLAAQKAVAAAVRRSGGTAEVEWVSAGRSFVADVLAVWHSDSEVPHRVVFEIQVSSQTHDRTVERDAVREAQADLTVWVLLAKPSEDDTGLVSAGWAHWSTEVPSILLLEDATAAGFWADELDGTDPRWSLTALASLVDAVGHRAVFLPAQHPWERGGWATPDLLQERERRLDLKRQKEEARRREGELHQRNRDALTARVKADLEVLKSRLTVAGHSPRVHRVAPCSDTPHSLRQATPHTR